MSAPIGDENNGNGKSRLDRLEGLMELLITDHTGERLNALITVVDGIVRRGPPAI